MTGTTLLQFGLACFVLFITPGPGMVAIMARTVQQGAAHGWVYGAGIFSGDIIILAGVVLGLATAAQAGGPWFPVFKVVAAGYLAYLCARSFWAVWRGRAALDVADGSHAAALAGDFAAGLATPFSNPKPILFYTAFVPAFFDLSTVGGSDFVLMALVMAVLASLATAAYVIGAVRLRVILLQPRVQRVSDGIMGVLFFVYGGARGGQVEITHG